MSTTSLPNISLAHSLQTVLQPNLMSAVLRSDYSFLQPGLASQILDVQGMMLGRPEEKILLLSNCANESSLKVLCRADASHICRVPALNKDFTLGTRALSSKGGDRDVKSICQMLVS